MTPAARQRLGERVRARRRELGLGMIDAARRAEVNRMTWDALEKGTRTTRDSNYAGIERTLQWRHGSVEAILNGGEPELLQASEQAAPVVARYTDPDTGETYMEQWERDLWDLNRIEMEERRKLIYYARSERARTEAERQPERRRRAAG